MAPRFVPPPIRLPSGRELTFERVRVMGVLNVTPDSFSDGGLYLDPEAAVARGVALAEAGADLIDVGGESTRPGAAPVGSEEQARRVVPVLRALRDRIDLPMSIDTTSASVARQALDAGAEIVNDISAFRFDPEMLPLLAERGVPAVAMHTLDRPAVMQDRPSYDDVVSEVALHLAGRLEAARAAGVDPRQVLVDPGIGFGKSLEQNLLLLRDLEALLELGRPIVVGTSRKSFLGRLTGRPVEERFEATAASVAVSIALGAHVVRVHDVEELRDTIRVAGAIAVGVG